MAGARPLTLRAERYRTEKRRRADSHPIASVWVDSGVFHLDAPFDYLVSEELDAIIQPGIRVVVPFNNREVEGIILRRHSDQNSRSLKWISKAISRVPSASEESLRLIKDVAQQWAAHPYDIIRSAIPPRSATVDREEWIFAAVSTRKKKSKNSYLQLPPATNSISLLADYCKRNPISGSRLVIFPDLHSVELLHSALPQSLAFTSDLPKEMRYRTFLKAFTGVNNTVIGVRSSIFLPIRDLEEILVVHEGSHSHYEERSPGWNTRDVALLRARNESLQVTFVGYSPSVEIAQLIEKGELNFRQTKKIVRVKCAPQVAGELLPGRIFTDVRTALTHGAVLFISERKGYAEAISCSKCRNIAICDCGGKIVQKGATATFECSLCQKSFEEFRCSWCQSSRPYLLSRGSERHAFEIGKAFPGIRIIESSTAAPFFELDDQKAIVVATPSVIPLHKSGYAAVILLNGNSFFSWSDVRGSERARDSVFQAAQYLSDNGSYILVLDPSHPITAALASWNPLLITRRELRDRESANLPPFTKAITIEVETSEISQIKRGLETARNQGRLPVTTKLYGPINLNRGISRILLFIDSAQGNELVALLHEFQRKRSISGKKMANIRIDPYSISQ